MFTLISLFLHFSFANVSYCTNYTGTHTGDEQVCLSGLGAGLPCAALSQCRMQAAGRTGPGVGAAYKQRDGQARHADFEETVPYSKFCPRVIWGPICLPTPQQDSIPLSSPRPQQEAAPGQPLEPASGPPTLL